MIGFLRKKSYPGSGFCACHLVRGRVIFWTLDRGSVGVWYLIDPNPAYEYFCRKGWSSSPKSFFSPFLIKSLIGSFPIRGKSRPNQSCSPRSPMPPAKNEAFLDLHKNFSRYRVLCFLMFRCISYPSCLQALEQPRRSLGGFLAHCKARCRWFSVE